MSALHGSRANLKYIYNGKTYILGTHFMGLLPMKVRSSMRPKRHLLAPTHVICIDRAPWVDGWRAREKKKKSSHGYGIFHLYGDATPGPTAMTFGALGGLVNVIVQVLALIGSRVFVR